MIKTIYGRSVVAGLLTAGLVSGIAYGQGFGGWHGPHGSLVPPIVGRLIGHDQIRSAIAADKTNLKNLFSQVHKARQQLVSDLVAGNDPTSDAKALGSAQSNLLAEKVKLAQNILGKLTPAQRTQVSQFLTQWNSLEESQRQQRIQLLQQFGGAGAAQAKSE